MKVLVTGAGGMLGRRGGGRHRDSEDWWAPIRSGEYREYYEKQYGRALG